MFQNTLGWCLEVFLESSHQVACFHTDTVHRFGYSPGLSLPGSHEQVGEKKKKQLGFLFPHVEELQVSTLELKVQYLVRWVVGNLKVGGEYHCSPDSGRVAITFTELPTESEIHIVI